MRMRRASFSQLLMMLICMTGAACAQGDLPHPVEDTSPHVTRMIDVDKDVKLEVLDWGGTGRPLILLAGMGSDAHVYDTFALRWVPPTTSTPSPAADLANPALPCLTEKTTLPIA